MSGLFGVGGGVIVIPALSYIFMQYTTISSTDTMQMAVGTSLAIMILTAMSSLYAHHKRNSVNWVIFRSMMPGLMIGSVVGAMTAHFLSSATLRIIFGLFLIFVSYNLIINKRDHSVEKKLSALVFSLASFLIGVLSSLLGVGGGALIVPFLLHSQLDMRDAAGTSVACGLTVGIVATISFMLVGLSSGKHAEWSTGYIYWPAFLGVAIASTLVAPIGAMLAHRLPRELLKRVFGLFLLLMACDMLFFK